MEERLALLRRQYEAFRVPVALQLEAHCAVLQHAPGHMLLVKDWLPTQVVFDTGLPVAWHARHDPPLTADDVGDIADREGRLAVLVQRTALPPGVGLPEGVRADETRVPTAAELQRYTAAAAPDGPSPELPVGLTRCELCGWAHGLYLHARPSTGGDPRLIRVRCSCAPPPQPYCPVCRTALFVAPAHTAVWLEPTAAQGRSEPGRLQIMSPWLLLGHGAQCPGPPAEPPA